MFYNCFTPLVLTLMSSSRKLNGHWIISRRCFGFFQLKKCTQKKILFMFFGDIEQISITMGVKPADSKNYLLWELMEKARAKKKTAHIFWYQPQTSFLTFQTLSNWNWTQGSDDKCLYEWIERYCEMMELRKPQFFFLFFLQSKHRNKWNFQCHVFVGTNESEC